MSESNKIPEPKILVIRHGERADKFPETKAQQEQHNPHLTFPVGWTQAVGAGKIIAATQEPERIWFVYSSPFMRVIETALGVMQSVRHTGNLTIDFGIGEHVIDDSCIPETTATLTEAAANNVIVAMAEKARATPFPARLGHGADRAREMLAPDSLVESGHRLLRSSARIYDEHMAMLKEQQRALPADEKLPLTGIIIMTHGFCGPRLMREEHGEELQIESVHLCSMIELRKNPDFDPSADPSSPIAADIAALPAFSGENKKKTASAAAVAPVSPHSPLIITYTRGINWRHPVTGETNTGTTDEGATAIKAAEQPQQRDPSDKTDYEPQHREKDPSKFFLSYTTKMDLPPGSRKMRQDITNGSRSGNDDENKRRD